MKLIASLPLAALATVVGFAAPSFAQQELNLRDRGVKPYTIELKPVSTALSAIPGVGGVGLGGEAFLAPKVAFFVDGAYLDVDLPGAVLDEVREETDDEAYPVSGYGYNISAGARWYSSPESHSWYGALGIGYQEHDGTWESSDVPVDSRTISTIPTAAAGFRWLWANNVLLRLGAGVGANLIQSQTITPSETTAAGQDAADAVDDVQDQYLLANVDLGLGVAF